jgi:hypothetical protein
VKSFTGIPDAIRKSLSSAGGRIEWIGAVLSMPFVIAAVLLWMRVARSPEFVSLSTAHLASGCFLATGLALGLYSTAWAFAAKETHHFLAACSAVLDSLACIALGVVLERYLFSGGQWLPFVIPGCIWLAAMVILVMAGQARKQVQDSGSGDIAA